MATNTAPTPPPAQWTQSVLGTGTAPNELFGQTVAFSGDGMTAVVGAYVYNPGNVSFIGQVYVYTKSVGDAWNQSATLSAPADLQATTAKVVAGFGFSVSVSGDGSTIAVGSSYFINTTNQVYVFSKTGSSWDSGTALDCGFNTTGTYPVSISGDGTTVVVGAPQYDTNVGRAYAFSKTGSGWGAGTVLATGQMSRDFLGWSVSVSGDGATAVVGAWGFIKLGRVFVFYKTAAGWDAGAPLGTGRGINDFYGGAVAVSGDGNTVIVGAEGYSSNSGQVFVYTKSKTWDSGTLLGAGAAVNDTLGSAVAVSADGTRVLVGAAGFASLTGQAYVYSKMAGNWGSAALLGTGAAPGDYYGSAVALSGDGTAALVGASGFSSDAGQTILYRDVQPCRGLTERLCRR